MTRGRMSRLRWPLAAAALVLACTGAQRPQAAADDAAPFAPPLAFAPLAGALDVAGGFCEYRRGHFHAGYDLGTERRVGRPVRAPLSGRIERVRASGVGYGRSIYLRADDGRLLVFGHLDAYAEPLASYVRAAQDSLGVYEQDLWPAADRFRFTAGDTIAWTGESGAGGPHLHFEIRRGDMAYHPARAGLVVRDASPPTLTEVTFEPLDEGSRVAGSSVPRTFSLARAETVEVVGQVRAVVGARDGVWSGVDRMVPWEVGLEWRGERVVCRFDSVSWATDMEQGDLVYDAGRVLDSKGIVMWARAGWRPRALRTRAPLHSEAGTIRVRAGDPPRPLRLWARDLGGGRFERMVVIRPGRPGAAAERAASPANGQAAGDALPRLMSLPGGAVRLLPPLAAAKSAVEWRWGERVLTTTPGDPERGAVFQPELRDSQGVVIGWRERTTAATPWRLATARAWRIAPGAARELHEPAGSRTLVLPADAVFEDVSLLGSVLPTEPACELVPLTDVWRLEPERLPLQRSVTLSLPLAPGQAGRDVGLYRRSEGEWAWIGAASDSTARTLSITSRQLGAFALFRDTSAPRIARWEAVRDSSGLPYSRWALEAVIEEAGSGLVARESWIEVDGRRVPTEWDPEASCLRWRPAARPAPGVHAVRIVAADRAGHVTRVEGSTTLGR